MFDPRAPECVKKAYYRLMPVRPVFDAEELRKIMPVYMSQLRVDDVSPEMCKEMRRRIGEVIKYLDWAEKGKPKEEEIIAECQKMDLD